MPKVPSCKLAMTSSEVLPRWATSRSWITPAPLKHRALTRPCFIRSMRTGDNPHLITCAPSIQMIGFCSLCARAICSINSRQSRPLRISGRPLKKRPSESLAFGGRANSRRPYSPPRRRTGIVRTLRKSIGRIRAILIPGQTAEGVSFQFCDD